MRRIKVLQFICPSGLYGAEMWVLALAKHLDTRAIDCRLVVTRESVRQNLELCYRFEGLGLQAHHVEMRGRFDPFVIPGLFRLIKRLGIDIIHTHGYKSDILGLIAARMAGIKAVATPHGFENSKDTKLQTFIRLGCEALKYFDLVVPLSEELQSDLSRLGIDSRIVRLVRNGVDLSEVEREKLDTSGPIFDDSLRKIAYVGQMAHRKNVWDLLYAFELLYKNRRECRLVLIGDGPQREALEARARSLNCASAISFLGYRRDRLKLLKEMDVFTMSSSLEGIPRCMMEAMAMEVPVAAYNIAGVDRLIFQEKTGLLAEFGHVEGLTTCWDRLLFDRDLSSRLARSAKEHIYTYFSAARMASEYTDLYRELIS